jgi:hypothetical protein
MINEDLVSRGLWEETVVTREQSYLWAYVDDGRRLAANADHVRNRSQLRCEKLQEREGERVCAISVRKKNSPAGPAVSNSENLALCPT